MLGLGRRQVKLSATHQCQEVLFSRKHSSIGPMNEDLCCAVLGMAGGLYYHGATVVFKLWTRRREVKEEVEDDDN